MWLQDPRCAEIVQDAWHRGLYKPDGVAIINYHSSCRDRLSIWNKTEFGQFGKQIERLNQKLQTLEQHPIRNESTIQEVRRALNRWLDAKNTMWHQCSRNMWLTYGD